MFDVLLVLPSVGTDSFVIVEICFQAIDCFHAEAWWLKFAVLCVDRIIFSMFGVRKPSLSSTFVVWLFVVLGFSSASLKREMDWVIASVL